MACSASNQQLKGLLDKQIHWTRILVYFKPVCWLGLQVTFCGGNAWHARELTHTVRTRTCKCARLDTCVPQHMFDSMPSIVTMRTGPSWSSGSPRVRTYKQHDTGRYVSCIITHARYLTRILYRAYLAELRVMHAVVECGVHGQSGSYLLIHCRLNSRQLLRTDTRRVQLDTRHFLTQVPDTKTKSKQQYTDVPTN